MVDILDTKLHRPVLHPNRVQRPHLVQRLNDGLKAARRLTLVCAPAGFGKTTCVGEWLAGLDLPVTWLALDRSDDDPGRFFAGLVGALQKVDASLGGEINSALHSGQLPSLDIIAGSLIEDVLRVGRSFILVLDDFQVIQDSAILQVLETLLASRQPLLHLVLVTREDPLLPLARLRANNQLTEIRASDLRFSAAETGRFLRDMMGLPLSAEDVAVLENRIEGWVAGLQLAALAMQGALSTRGRSGLSNFIANLSGSQRYILSYLTEEVLNRQSADIQEFLLQTSILDRLTGDLCDAVTERSGSGQLLEHLLSANLFLIALDDEAASGAGAGWYRFHHLFADLLRNQQGRVKKEQTALLHLRASLWYEQADMPNEAISHALSGEDYPRAVQLLEQHAMPVLTQGYAKTLEGWLQAVPEQWRAHSTRTNLAFAWMHLLRGSYLHIPSYLRQVEAALAQDGEADAALRAEWLALQSNLANVQGRGGEGIQLAEQALKWVPPDNAYLLALSYLGLGGGYRITGDYPRLVDAYQKAIYYSQLAGVLLPEMISASALVLVAVQYGQLRFALEAGTRSINRFDQNGILPPPVAGTVYGTVGVVYYQWNELEKAGEYFRRAAQMSRLVGHNAGIVYNAVLSARLAQAIGDQVTASQLTQEAARLLPKGVPAWLKPDVAEQQVRLALARANPAAAEAALQMYGEFPEKIHAPFEALALAHLRVALYRLRESPQTAGLFEQALASANRLVDETTRDRRVGVALQALLLRAQLHAAHGSTPSALDDIAAALALAAPEANIRVFLDEGLPVAGLLHCFLEKNKQKEGAEAAFARKLLASFHPPDVPAESPLPAASDQSDRLLTGRELEVLRLIAEGLTYEEIASHLVISLNTVRFYVKEIYSKLNVNNRTRAVEEARRLQLL